MAEKPVTKEYLDKSFDKLGRMIAKGFEENTKQHQRIFEILDKHVVMSVNHAEMLKEQAKTLKQHTKILKQHTETLNTHTKILKEDTERLHRIEMKLEGVVYHKEFEELKKRVEEIEGFLASKKK